MSDLDEVMQWLHIEERARHLPHLSNLYRLAMSNLRRLNDEHEGAADSAEKAEKEAKEPPQTEDEMKAEPQPAVPDPLPTEDLSTMNHDPEERIEAPRIDRRL